jgi:RNA polymerase sigma-70 factor (ECF subfamily)
MLDDLPPEQAETLRLKCYDGLTFKQIGELQDVSEATVKSRYRYAIMSLKEKIEKTKGV